MQRELLISNLKNLYSAHTRPWCSQCCSQLGVWDVTASPLQVQDGRVEGCACIFSCENSKITTHCCWTTVDRRCWIPPERDTLCPRAKKKPQQDGRRGEITFRIKPHTHQRCLEGTNKTLCTPGDPTGTEPDLPLRVRVSHVEVWVNSGLPQGQGLWVQQTWVWHKPSWRRSPLTPQQSRQNLHRTGDTDSWRAQTKPLVYQDPGEKGSDPTRDWPRLAHECPGVTGRGLGWQWPGLGSGLVGRVEGTECSSVWMWPFEGGPHYLHYIHHSLAAGQTTGREHSPAHQHKTELKIYWAWPRPSEQDPVSPSVSLSHQEASISLLSLSIRGQTE